MNTPPDSPGNSRDQASPPAEASEGRPSFFAELKRRKVVRVAITYSFVAWLIIQVAAATFEGFGIPVWAFRFVVIMLLLGFPVAIIITWAFELTPEGVKLTRNVSESDKSKASGSKRNWLAFGFGALLPTVIFGVIALVFYFGRGEVAALGTQQELPESDKSVAVLPFRNMSAEAGNEYFCDGVQEDILTYLANLGDLRVISRTSVMQYRETSKTIGEIALELGVAYILEGSVQRFGNRVRVTGQLIDAREDQHLWAKNYDRELVDIFKIQGELAQEIANSLHAVLSPREKDKIGKHATVDPAAYDLVLRGRALRRKHTAGEFKVLEQMESLFDSATQIDPDYPDAWVELSYAHVRLFFTSIDPTPERLEMARVAIEKAVELAPDSTPAIIGYGNYFYYGFREYAKAREQFERALSQSPNNVEAIAALGYISRREGKWMESMDHLKKAVSLDPRNYPLLREYLKTLEMIRWYKEGLEITKRMEALRPDDVFAQLRPLFFEGNLTGSMDNLVAWANAVTPEDWKQDEDYIWAVLWIRKFAGDASGWFAFLEQDLPEVVYENTRDDKVFALFADGQVEAARVLARALLEEASPTMENASEDFNYLNTLSIYNAFLGNREEALAAADQAIAMSRKVEDSLLQIEQFAAKAETLIWLGDTDEALDMLEDLYNEPFDLSVIILRRNFVLYPVWENPRFNAIMDDPKNRQPLF